MEDRRFTLTRIRIRNYRSIAVADVEVGPLLLLVGPNGSGKSNFLDALRLLAEALQTSMDQALRARGGVGEVRRRSTGHPRHLSIEVHFRGPTVSGSYSFEVAGVPGGGFRVARERCELGNVLTGAFFDVKDGKVTSSSEAVMPPASTDRLYLVVASGLEVFRPVFDGLAGISVFNLNPEAMRAPQTPDTGSLLRRDGSNIASVLHRMERSEEGRRGKARVEAYLQQIVPGMRGVFRTELGNWESLVFAQDVAGSKNPWQFQANSVSDGTLRALGILTALFASSGSTLSTVGIEEPESALHPAATAVLLDALRDASERRQIVVTSHSPDLLDRHDIALTELRAVRSSEGVTRIGELDDAGALALREHLFTAGELLRNDQLLPAPTNAVR